MPIISDNALDTIYDHKSIRSYSEDKIPEEVLYIILEGAFKASTSNYLLCVSVIRVTDYEKRLRIQEAGFNQPYISKAPEFLVFCIDFAKHKYIYSDSQVGEIEKFVTGVLDVAIVTQTALIAAESMGMCGVMISSFRDKIEMVSRVLDMPKFTVPLLGLCLGYPKHDDNTMQKPRMPLDLCVFENTYQELDNYKVAKFDKHVGEYYEKRGYQNMNYSNHIRGAMGSTLAKDLLTYLKKQGFIEF